MQQRSSTERQQYTRGPATNVFFSVQHQHFFSRQLCTPLLLHDHIRLWPLYAFFLLSARQILFLWVALRADYRCMLCRAAASIAAAAAATVVPS